MKHRRRSSSSSYSDDSSLLGRLLKYVFILIILSVVGGITWLALTPMTAPSQQVIRAVPNEKLGGPT